MIGLCLRASKAALKRAEKTRKAATIAAASSGKSGRPRMDQGKRDAIKADYKAGTLAEMAVKHSVGADTVRRIWLEVDGERAESATRRTISRWEAMSFALGRQCIRALAMLGRRSGISTRRLTAPSRASNRPWL